MASFVLSYMPNPIIKNSATSVTDTIPSPCSWKQDHLPLVIKSNDPLRITLSCPEQTRSHITSSSNAATNLANVWREIHGSNNWENLVDPLGPLLRSEIIRYGEFVNGCYKAIDLDPNSKRFLTCKYGKRNMLKEIGLPDSGYEVTKYIYATAPDIGIPIQPRFGSCARWVGYVAVSEDKEIIQSLGRRDILITFRGTITNPEWVANLNNSLIPAGLDPCDIRPNVKVQAGFLGLYTSNESCSNFGMRSCRDQLLSEVSRLINKYKGDEMSITLVGHSMGSSLALLLAYDISELDLNKGKDDIPVTVFSFGGPRVGNSGFKERCEELGVKVLRIVNVNDPITKLPGLIFNEKFKVLPWSYCSCYAHVGAELALDFFQMRNPSCVHDLESYIMLLKSCSKSFEKKVQRDEDGLQWVTIALVISMVNLVYFLCL